MNDLTSKLTQSQITTFLLALLIQISKFIDCVYSFIRENDPDIEITVENESSKNYFHQGVNYKMQDNDTDIVEGGFVDRTQTLLGNKKERLSISGAGIDLQILSGIVRKDT